MAHDFHESAQKTGLPPASFKHTGPVRQKESQIFRWDFLDGQWQEKTFHSLEEWITCDATVEHPVCLHITGLSDISWLKQVSEQYGMHELALEDILHTHQRPKLDHYNDHLLLVMKSLHLTRRSSLDIEQVSLMIRSNLLIIFWEQEPDWLANLLHMAAKNPSIPQEHQLNYLAYLIMDGIVDRYFLVLENLGERMELLETHLLRNFGPRQMSELHILRRDLLLLRKIIWPLREVFTALERNQILTLQENLAWYFRDVYDHTLQVIDTIEMYRDTLSSFLDIYLSSVNNRMNEVMKVLTIISTLFIPLTFLAGIYGMNFKYMPELEWEWGYPALLLFMLCIASGMLVYFRRRHWL